MNANRVLFSIVLCLTGTGKCSYNLYCSTSRSRILQIYIYIYIYINFSSVWSIVILDRAITFDMYLISSSTGNSVWVSDFRVAWALAKICSVAKIFGWIWSVFAKKIASISVFVSNSSFIRSSVICVAYLLAILWYSSANVSLVIFKSVVLTLFTSRVMNSCGSVMSLKTRFNYMNSFVS